MPFSIQGSPPRPARSNTLPALRIVQHLVRLIVVREDASRRYQYDPEPLPLHSVRGHHAVVRNASVFTSDPIVGSWNSARSRTDSLQAIVAPEGNMCLTIGAICHETQLKCPNSTVRAYQLQSPLWRQVRLLKSVHPLLERRHSCHLPATVSHHAFA